MTNPPSGENPNSRKRPFDHLTPGRECGDCVACCKILAIDKPDLKKPAHTLCRHCTGKGCGIYDSRPAVCRTWYCLWRRIDEMPDELRPDRVGVVFSFDRHNPPRTPFEQFYIVGRAIHGVADFSNSLVTAAIHMFVKEGSLPVWLSFAGSKKLIYPDEALAMAVLGPGDVPPHLAEAVQAWRARLKISN